MAQFIIENGWDGQPNKAKVDDHGRLYVVNNHVSHMSHHSTYHKNAYAVPFETTLPDATQTPVFLFGNNDSTKDIECFDLIVSANADVEIDFYLNSGYTSGGASVDSTNLNVGAGKVFTPVAYEGGDSGDLVVDTTNEELLGGEFISANTRVANPLEGAIVLSNNYYMSIKATGANPNVVKGYLFFTIHEEGTKL